MDDEKPDTRHLVLKPKEIFPIDNPSRAGDGSAISVQLIHRQNQVAEEKASKGKRRGARPPPGAPTPAQVPPGFKAKEIAPVNRPAHAGDEEAISVPEILIENQIAEVESGLANVKRRKRRRSRRTRDFILVVGGLDLAIVIAMKLMPGVISVIFGLSAIALLTSMLAWVVFGVMDDY